ncbi:MAG: serine/threonine protein kinase [Pirellulales bacterium]|nr:serine/threonine protein kinase [Pirellulales bacterium]
MSSSPHSLLEQAGLASGLLTQEQIDRAWDALVAGSAEGDRCLNDVTDELLAEHLVALGFVNRWQAEQLRQGRTKFTLGPYRIFDAIGRGGMGYVFKGEHQLLGRIEAIKVLPRSQMTPMSIASFCREIRAQAQLDHPNLVRLSFADRDGETYYLVTEYVPGSDLRRLVRHHGPLDDEQAAWVIAQAAEALAYAHERGLVHRDVKPGNLLVTPEGRTKLTDLGLAAFANDAEPAPAAERSNIVGTPDFLAPECVLSPQAVRPASDVYSLGCTLYYAVTGKVPFPGGRTSEKLRRHVEELPITPRRFNSAVHDDLMDLIAAMTRKRPEDRIATAAEVVERLRPWTERLDERRLQALGQCAGEQQERSLITAGLADTLPAEGVDATPSSWGGGTPVASGSRTRVEGSGPKGSAASPAAVGESAGSPLESKERLLSPLARLLLFAAIATGIGAALWVGMGR